MKVYNKIKRIQIKNFRRFEELTLEFDEGNYFVLIGPNAVGKTSTLEAINIAFSERSSKFTEVKETDFYSDDPIELIVELNDYFFLSFEDEYGFERLIPCKNFKKIIKRRITKERGKLFSTPYEVSWKFEPQNFVPDYGEFSKIEERYRPILEKRQKIVRYFEYINEEKFKYRIKTKPNEDILKEHIGFQYMKRVLFPEIFYYDNNRERELLSSYNTTLLNIVNELEWRYKKHIIQESELKKSIINQSKNLFNTINETIEKQYQKKLFDEAKRIFNKELRIEEIDIESLAFFFFNYYQPYSNAIFGLRTKTNQILPILNIGAGLSTLLALSLSISFAKESDNPVIILIDEPEIHLEPRLQKRLKKYLCENLKLQTMIATHSHLFLDYDNTYNNIALENTDNQVKAKYCSPMDVSDLQFRLLGNSIEDLFIPEKILLVEGKFDKEIILKCLELLFSNDLNIQIVPVGGKDRMPNKPEVYEEVLDEILKKGKWYSEYIVKVLKIVVDQDVNEQTIEHWSTTYGLDKSTQIKKINKPGIEFLFPESLVKECVKHTKLRDGNLLRDKEKEDIIKIILDDDDLSDKSMCKQIENRVSKSRFNTFVVENITKDILNSKEGEPLINLINWITQDL